MPAKSPHQPAPAVGRKVFTVQETADALRVSRRTVWRLIGLGELAKVALGRAVRITVESVEAFIARGGAR